MRMKGFLMGTLLLMATVVHADEYAYLNVNSSAGETSYTVENISKITFDADNMVLNLTDGTHVDLPLAGLDKMWFGATGAGIGSVTASTVNMRIIGGVLTVTTSTDRESRVTLYNIGGTMLAEAQTNNGEAQLNLNGMQKGVYIVRMNDQSKKIMNR